ncbi:MULTISPECIES: transglutaminase family protein [unclassified Streptomyces]|uniref:transglutaminase-like domain-containing protein n=1 Tax=unclassified Streptomyces TaxID=2593676 RepID=UPI00278BCCB7|nr:MULTISPECIES: transglutaminase family protein [unclassified Streptomyces]
MRRLAVELHAGRDPRETAVAAFHHVRDGIRYRIGDWQQTASQTLELGEGTCTNSANLLVALLRSVGIPAGYGVMRVRGREYFGPIALPRLARMVSEVSRHVYACVHLDGRWVRCDPSDDLALSLGSAHLNPQSRPVEWDGERDAVLHLDADHIQEDVVPVADISALMAKRMRRTLRLTVRLGNLYMDFLREHGARMRTTEEADKHFTAWLRDHHPTLHLLYRALPEGSSPAEPALR